MSFEKKQLATIALMGSLDKAEIPLETISYTEFQPGHHILTFGLPTRRENDAEEALYLSLKLRRNNRKIMVLNDTVLFIDNRPQIVWQDHWKNWFSLLTDGEIGVGSDLVRIYQRIFDIHAKKKGRNNVFLLKEKKKSPYRVRGVGRKYSPLIGRQKEIKSMLEIIEQSFEDQGQIASIVGEAGIGKTRIKDELIHILKEKNIRYYEGFFSLNSDITFRGFHQIVHQILGDDPYAAERFGLSKADAGFLNHFLYPQNPNEFTKNLNEEDLVQGVFQSVQRLLHSAGKEPLVLILEDFHWGGGTSVKMMEYLAQGMEKTKIAFFLFHRPTYEATFKRRLNYYKIELSAFDHEEVKKLVKDVLHLDYITDAAIEQLTKLSLGNPFFVEEVLRELIAQKKLQVDKTTDIHRVIYLTFPEGKIPSSLESLISARLDLLPKATKEVLQWACAFGFRENHDDFELLLKSMDKPLDLFQELFDAGYIEEASMFPQHKYRFRHDLVYESVRQSIPETDWIEKNQAIAEFLHQLYGKEMINEGDRVAEFYIRGKMDEKSFDPIFEAATVALTQRRYARAMRYFEHAHQIYRRFKVSVDAADFFEPYTEAVFASGSKETIQMVISSWEKAGFSSLDAEFRFYKNYLDFLHNFRVMKLFPTVAEYAVSKFRNSKFAEESIIFEVRHFQALIYLFEFSKATHLGYQLLRKINGMANIDDIRIDLYYGLGFITQQTGYPDVGSYITLIAKKISDRTGLIKQQIRIGRRIAYLLNAQGYYEETLRTCSDLIYMAQQNGYLKDLVNLTAYRILNNYFLGRYEKAIEEFAFFDPIDKLDWNKKWTVNWVGQAYLASGAFEKVREVIGTQRYFSSRDPYIRCNLLYLAGNYHYQREEYRKSESCFRYAKVLYRKKEQDIYSMQMNLFELRCQLLQKKIDLTTASKQFDTIAADSRMRKHFHEWITHLVCYSLSRLGCNTRFKPSLEFDPMNCKVVSFRLQLFIEKIKWLESAGMKPEAEKLREQYSKHRKEMEFYVPKDFKKSYLEHPFYQA